MEIKLADGPLTDKQKQEIARSLRTTEKAPSTRHFSDSYRYYQEQLEQVGTPYDVTRIPIPILQQMERDPMIAFGLHFIRTPIMRARWHIECERADIAAFVDNALRRILPSFIQQYTRSFNYGFSPIVKRFQLENPDWKYKDKDGTEKKVWDNGSVEAITWKNFIPLPPDPNIVEPSFTDSGRFNGIDYNGGRLPVPFQPLAKGTEGDADRQGIHIPVTHALWATNEKETANGSLWGYPRVGYAYRFWWSYWHQRALYDRFFERKSDPPYVVYYPTGGSGDYAQEDENQEPESMRAIALSIGESARSGGVIAMPGDLVRGYDDRPTNTREWEIFELEVKGNMDHFMESFEYLDIMKLRSLWISELSLIEGSGGTSSRNVANEEIGFHKEGTAVTSDEIDEHINRFVIPDIVAANFPEFNGDVRKVTTGFTEADHQALRDVLQLIGQSDVSALEHVDMREILDILGYPLVSIEEIERREEEAKKAIEDAKPDPIAPTLDSAGVDEQGFYISARERIVLADETEFISSLPNSKHYEDKKIKESAAKLRKTWKNAYSDIYNDFADFLSKLNRADLSLAEDDADKIAQRIVNNWAYSRERIDKLISLSQSEIHRIIRRAAELELENIESDVKWQPSKEEIADWLDERGALLVKSIDDNIRQELKNFLAEEIRKGTTENELANSVREHFSDFPDWKANRLVRTEIRDSYNFATIAAGEKAGVSVVQAIDAQLGEHRSDPECIARNGKFFKIKDALKEVIKEHPNGTIGIKLTNLKSVPKVVNATEDEDTLAFYNDDINTIILDDSLPYDEKIEYLDQLGDIFEMELRYDKEV